MKMDILGIGEVVVDWVAVIDHFPEPDEKIDSKNQSLFSGGVTANYIVAASRLGANSSFIGAIGNDEYGTFLKEDFTKEKVNIDGMVIKKGKKTPVNFICVVEKNGEKFIIQSPYMHTTVPEPKELNENIISSAKLIHTTGIYPEVTTKSFEIAKKNNIKISFDLEKQIAIRGIKNLKPMLQKVDILMPNKAGAMQLTNTKTPIDAAKIFLDWGIEIVVITMGAEGCLALTKSQTFKVPSLKVNVIDTTGAGDTFCAAFDYVHVIKGFTINDSCIFANACAALKIQKLGARTGMPSYKEVKSYIETQNIKLNQKL
jgi:ribokinase